MFGKKNLTVEYGLIEMYLDHIFLDQKASLLKVLEFED